MAPAESLQRASTERVDIDGRELEYRLVPSRSARKLRIRVTPDGIEVVLPADRSRAEATDFLVRNLAWVSREIARAARIRSARAIPKTRAGELPFLGETVAVEIHRATSWRATSRVSFQGETIRISTGPAESPVRIGKTLEGWLRRQAKARIEALIAELGGRIGRTPNRVYAMDQRTKWGNCSRLGNLSFNWRLVMAPEYVLRYMVTHEMVHLAIPDHSRRFWLTVQSLCPDSERARQWLVANAERLMRIDCVALCAETSPRPTSPRDAA